MAKHWNTVVRAETVMVDDDGVEHPWPSIHMKFPEQDYDGLVEVEQEFQKFIDGMFAKGPARVEAKKKTGKK